MILNQQQIEEIERNPAKLKGVYHADLLETVKAQRELLRRAVFYANRIDSQAAQSLAEQIEEHLK